MKIILLKKDLDDIGGYGWFNHPTNNIYIPLEYHETYESIVMTLVHELVHYYMHKSQQRSREYKEFEACKISELALKHMGLKRPRFNSKKYSQGKHNIAYTYFKFRALSEKDGYSFKRIQEIAQRFWTQK